MTYLASAAVRSPVAARVANHARTFLKQPAQIAILGCGTIGSEVARAILESSSDSCGQALGLQLSGILVRHPSRVRAVPFWRLTDDFETLLADQPDIIVEALGGMEPAFSYVRRALERGISVVTANKSLVAHHGAELRAIAHRSGAALAYEASVGAAVPVLAALRNLHGDRVRSIRGVINGTCNFILTQMTDARISFDAALDEAGKLGLAEPDPTADISGRDSAEKLCVLASSIGIELRPAQVQTVGIENITPADIDAARARGCMIKLLATLERDGAGSFASVSPTLVPRRHALAQPCDAQNCIEIDSERSGTLTLIGEGAGAKPTAAAIIGDVLRILQGDCTNSLPLEAIPAHWTPTGRSESWLIRVRRDRTGVQPQALLDALKERAVAVREIDIRRDCIEIILHADDRRSIESALDTFGERPSFFAAPFMTNKKESGRSN